MKQNAQKIGFCLQIALLLCCMQGLAQPKTLIACDSCTVLTPIEVKRANRVYDDRNECYQQYINVVAIATRMQERHNLQIKALEKAQSEMYTRQQVQEMTDAQLEDFQKTIKKLQKAVNRNKTLVWILTGYGAAATVVAAVFIGTK